MQPAAVAIPPVTLPLGTAGAPPDLLEQLVGECVAGGAIAVAVGMGEFVDGGLTPATTSTGADRLRASATKGYSTSRPELLPMCSLPITPHGTQLDK